MTLRNGFKYGPAAIVAALALMATNACSDNPADNPLCCNEFKAGGTITADIGGSAESRVAVQALADVSGIAAAAVDDITTACRGIATDLDAPKADQDAANAATDKRAKMDKWCAAAVNAIVKVKAAGSIKATIVPARCSASISAKANCQAQCSGSASCDIKANPPKCTGGSLQVACKGECKAKANVSLKCEGKCTAACKGECTAQGGVQCAGKCEGECVANAGTGPGTFDAQGNCTSTCKGKCSVTPPGVTCTGSCNGECSGSCTGTADAAVKCDGDCQADFEPLKCEGGKLEGGCKVEAKCDANCDASVKAKAECTPPEVAIVFTGSAEIAAKVQATLEANLPLILQFKTRLEGVAEVAGTFSANIKGVADIKAACIPPVVAAVGTAVQDLEASVKATASISGQIGG